MAARLRPIDPPRNARRRSDRLPSGVRTLTDTAVSSPRGTARTARPTSAAAAVRASSARRARSTSPSPAMADSVRSTPSNPPRRAVSAPPIPSSTMASVQPRCSSAAETAPAQVVSPVAHTYRPRCSSTTAPACATRSSAPGPLEATRTSTASTLAYVATWGSAARSRSSPSNSATCDSPMPWRRQVRATISRPRPRASSRGRASSCHIARISRGGPGSVTTTRPSGARTSQPGAVPFGFGSASADGIRQACLRLTSGKAIPRRSNRSRSHASISGSIVGSSPTSAAIASRVRSSGVGPSPPVVTTRSARPSAASSAPRTTSRSSGSACSRRTCTPRAVRSRASSPAFVSRVSPTVISLPTLSSSAVKSRRSGVESSISTRVPCADHAQRG